MFEAESTVPFSSNETNTVGTPWSFRNSGVDAAGAVGAPFVQYKRDSFLDPEGTAVAFALDLVAKDLDLALDLASEVGASTSQLATNRSVVGEAIAAGYGEADLSAIAQHLRGDSA